MAASPAPFYLHSRFWVTGLVKIADGCAILSVQDLAARTSDGAVALRLPRLAALDGGISSERWLAPWIIGLTAAHADQRTVLATGARNGVPYVIHEWFAGGTFLDLMAAAAAAVEVIPLRFALHAASLSLAASEQAARVAGLTAADPRMPGRLGPHRVRVTPTGRLVVATNFMYADRATPGSTPSSAAEYAYVAPEYARTGVATEASDTWAICAMLEAAAMGRNRNERDTLAETSVCILKNRLPRPNPLLPGALRGAVFAGLQPDPTRRLGVRQGLDAALRQALKEAGGAPSAQEWAVLAARYAGGRARPALQVQEIEEGRALFDRLRGTDADAQAQVSTPTRGLRAAARAQWLRRLGSLFSAA